MFLQQLYRHSKWLFAVVLIFIAGQLFINFKRGIVVSPFYHYGMYSKVIKPKPFYQVFEVWANGKQLHGADFMPWTWDKIIQPLAYYTSIPESNRLFKDDIEKLLHKLQPNEKQFLDNCDYKGFENWYKIYLGKILQLQVSDIDLKLRTYQYAEGNLNRSDNVQLLSALCR